MLFFVSLLCATLTRAQPDPGGVPASVQYNPQEKVVQGNQPLIQSYSLDIIAPSNLPVGTSTTVDLVLSVLAKPATGVTDTQALGFISLSPSTLTFTGPSQTRTTTVAVNVPVGNVAGQYAYKILPSGWPLTTNGITDSGATVNAIADPQGSTDSSPPTITLLSPSNGAAYTYSPASGLPVTVPINFAATVGTGGFPIDGMVAFINNTTVNVTAVGVPSLSASATGSAQLTAGGTYTVTVGATNRKGTSWATADINVTVSAPPPTITPSLPTNNASYTYTLGTAGVSVPVSFTATSIYGNISSLAATLNGSPITLSLAGVGTSTTASGSASLLLNTAGTYNLVLSAANAYGAATPVTIPFKVTGTTPAPSVSITSPANGSIFTRASGSPPTVVNFTFQGGTSYGTITSAIVKVDGSPVTATVNGLNTASITGTGALSYSAAGQHTLNVTVTNSGGATASTSSTFSIEQTSAQICRDLTWLPPISLNKTIEGGSTMPIKFTLDCNGKFVRDTSVLIAIYEVFRNGSTSTPTIYHYGTGSPNPPDYVITGQQYHLNFPTAKGVHSYKIEVYSSASGSVQLLGSKELNTKKAGGNCDDDHHGNCDDDDDDDHERQGDCNGRDGHR